MVDFQKSLQMGIDAARVAVASQAEIDEILENLNAEIAKVTDNKVKITVGNYNALRDAGFPSMPFDLKTKKHDYKALEVRHTSDGRFTPRRIARWVRPAEGYPVELELSGEIVECSDKSGLERTLSRMLQQPHVGKAIQECLDYTG